MSSLVDTLVDKLETLGCVKVLKKSESEGSIRLLCRVINKKKWSSILENVLLNKDGWEEHICQQYFLKDRKLVYGWNFIINSTDMDKAIKSICRNLREAAPINEGGDIDSIPLVGAYRPANTDFDVRSPGPTRGGHSHKGAYPVSGK
jgi:hypothetical protein